MSSRSRVKDDGNISKSTAKRGQLYLPAALAFRHACRWRLYCHLPACANDTRSCRRHSNMKLLFNSVHVKLGL